MGCCSKDKGIDVEVGVNEDKAALLTPGFLHTMRKKDLILF